MAIDVITIAEQGPAGVPATIGRGNRTVALGDSITLANSTATAWFADGWFYLGCMLSGGRIRPIANAGVAGNTTAQMLARLATDVIVLAPNKCIVLGGTNDVASVPLATSLANIQAIVDRLAAAGIEPVLCTIPPRNDGYHSAIGQLNAAIKEIAAKLGVTVLDFHAVTVDPSNGNWKSGYTSDGIHPIRPGTKAMAAVVRDVLTPTYPQVAPYLAQEIIAAGPANLLTNGVFVGDTNTDGIANSWARAGSGGTQTPTLVAGTGDVIGNWQVLTTTVAGANYNLDQAIAASGNFAVGDRMLITGRLTTTLEAGGQTLILWMLCSNGATPVFAPLYLFSTDVSNAVFAMEFVVPAGTTHLSPQIIPSNTGTGTVQVAQVALANLTALGVT